MENVGWRFFTIDHWKGSGQDCWKGGIYFGTKESFDLTITILDECMPTCKPSKQ